MARKARRRAGKLPLVAAHGATQAKVTAKYLKQLRAAREAARGVPSPVAVVAWGKGPASLLARFSKDHGRLVEHKLVSFPTFNPRDLERSWPAGAVLVVDADEVGAVIRKLKRIRSFTGEGRILAVVAGASLREPPLIPGVRVVTLPRTAGLGAARLGRILRAGFRAAPRPTKETPVKPWKNPILGKSFGAPGGPPPIRSLLPGSAPFKPLKLSSSAGKNLPPVPICAPIPAAVYSPPPRTPAAVPDRRVDAQMWRKDAAGAKTHLEKTSRLKRGDLLKLGVHIGNPGPHSLVVDNSAPPIDLQLPALIDGAFHALQVLVFPMDFVLQSEPVREVRLYKAGDTPSVWWDLLLPVEGAEPDGAQKGASVVTLRFSVCFRNQVLQSFVLKARLKPDPAGASGAAPGDPPLFVRYDYSQVRQFERLETLKPRFLAAGVSTNPSGATHTLSLGKDGQAIEIHWPEGQMAAYTNAVRAALFDALSPGGAGSPYLFDPTTLKLAGTPPQFDASIRKLAATGRAVWDQLITRNQAALRPFQEVARSSGETLQIVRHDIDYAFPWTLLYDFALPRGRRQAAAPVCRGQGADGGACSCGSEPAGFCLRGFWGIRHVIEQRCSTAFSATGDPGVISEHPTQPAICVVPGYPDAFVKSYIDAVPAALSKRVLDPVPDDLLSVLREPGTRPELIVYVGHMEEASVYGIPTPQLVNLEGDAILSRSDITEEMLQETTWDQPKSLVLLMACGSGVSRVDLGTGLAASLLQLGAEGVLGAECRVYTGIASRVARDITQRLARNEPMGESVRATIAALAAEGCPVGLAFTYLGPAELRLPQ